MPSSAGPSRPASRLPWVPCPRCLRSSGAKALEGKGEPLRCVWSVSYPGQGRRVVATGPFALRGFMFLELLKKRSLLLPVERSADLVPSLFWLPQETGGSVFAGPLLPVDSTPVEGDLSGIRWMDAVMRFRRWNVLTLRCGGSHQRPWHLVQQHSLDGSTSHGRPAPRKPAIGLAAKTLSRSVLPSRCYGAYNVRPPTTVSRMRQSAGRPSSPVSSRTTQSAHLPGSRVPTSSSRCRLHAASWV